MRGSAGLLLRCNIVGREQLALAQLSQSASGGTICEHLVIQGMVSDEQLTGFFRQRLMVPQIHPQELAQIAQYVIASIPVNFAVSYRVVPVRIDRGSVVLAMSDPEDDEAVQHIEAAIGARVVRCVATQSQIAWCLARYYSHVTPLAKLLLKPETIPPVSWDDEGKPRLAEGTTDGSVDRASTSGELVVPVVRDERRTMLPRVVLSDDATVDTDTTRRATIRPSQPQPVAPEASIMMVRAGPEARTLQPDEQRMASSSVPELAAPDDTTRRTGS